MQRWVVVGVSAALVMSACTPDPQRVAALPPSCPGSDEPAYAYTTASDSGVDIFGLRPDGDVVQLTQDGGSSSPSFTPDGRSIVFSRANPGRPGASSPPSADSVWIMRADGSEPREVLRLSRVDSVSVSPDGTRLAVTGQVRTDRPDGGVYVAGIDGDGVRRVYSPPGRGQHLFGYPPAWSPDGSEVAVSITANGRFAIYAISVADGSWREVTAAESVSDPSWSADGSTISFISEVPQRGENPYDVFTVPATGGEPRRAASDADAMTTSATDGAAWLIQRQGSDHELVLTDAEGAVDRLVLPPLQVEQIGTATVAPCALL